MKSKIHINLDKRSIIKQHTRKQKSITTKTGITRLSKTVIDITLFYTIAKNK